MTELKPNPEHLSDPYVLQLIEALSMQQDEIERLTAKRDFSGICCDNYKPRTRPEVTYCANCGAENSGIKRTQKAYKRSEDENDG